MALQGRPVVLVLPGMQNLPIWAMDERARALSYTLTFEHQVAALQSGQADIIHTAPDHLWEAGNPAVVPFMGGSGGPLHLVVRGERPWRLAVDAVSSGFAVLAYRWLQRHQIRDYRVVAVGGAAHRYRALLAGQAEAAVLNPPYTQAALDRGWVALARVDRGAPTMVGAVRREDLDHPGLEAYRQAYREALERLWTDPERAAGLLAIHAGAEFQAYATTAARALVETMWVQGIALRPARLDRLRRWHRRLAEG